MLLAVALPQIVKDYKCGKWKEKSLLLHVLGLKMKKDVRLDIKGKAAAVCGGS